MKTCLDCKIEKEENEFCKDKNRKDGLNPLCKICVKEYKKQYQIKNKDKISQKNKENYNKNKEIILIKNKQWRIKNKNNIKNYEYKRNRTEERKKQRKERHRKNKIQENISNQIRKRLLSQNSSKRGESIFKYLPYTMEQLKQHLEKLWEPWMNWDNHGKVNLIQKTWHIDHIIPQSLLPYDSMEHPNFQKCWTLSNLRPLEAIENIKKSNKLL